jgi:hypothetical protein
LICVHKRTRSEQLEFLEDKLRECRFSKQSNSEQKAVLLGQLDAVRRELLEVLSINSSRVVFAKEVVREVYMFASSGEDVQSHSIASTPSGVSLHPAYGSRPERVLATTPKKKSPSHQGGRRLTEEGQSMYSLMASPKPLPLRSSPNPLYRDPAFNKTYENDLWDGQSGVNLTSSFAGGEESHRAVGRAARVAGAQSKGQSGELRPRQSSYTFRMPPSAELPAKISDEDIYGPPSSRSLSLSKKTQTWEARSPSSSKYGGVVKIRDMLERAERGLSAVADAQEQRRAMPPRIVNEEMTELDSAMLSLEQPGEGMDMLTPRDTQDDVSHTYYTGINDTTPLSASKYRWSMGRREVYSMGRRSTNVNSVSPYSNAPTTGSERGSEGFNMFRMAGRLASLTFLLGGIVAGGIALNGVFNADNPKTSRKQSSKSRSRPAHNEFADMPPWSDGYDDSDYVDVSHEISRNRKDIPPVPGHRSSQKRAVRKRGGKSSSDSERGPQDQAPVMHVHQPPSTASFPSTPPPDVTAAMG